MENLHLAGGRWAGEGRVEIRLHDQWGTVCDKNWDDTDAAVTCRSLGLSGGVAKRGAFFGPGLGPVHVSDVACRGGERLLALCPRSNETSHCRHSRDAGVVCATVPGSARGSFPPNVTNTLSGVTPKRGGKFKDGDSEMSGIEKDSVAFSLSALTSGPQLSRERPRSDKKWKSNDSKTNTNVPASIATERLVPMDVQTKTNIPSITSKQRLVPLDVQTDTNIPTTTTTSQYPVLIDVRTDADISTTTQISVELAEAVHPNNLKQSVDADLIRAPRPRRKKRRRNTETLETTEDVDPSQDLEVLSQHRPKRQEESFGVISTDVTGNITSTGNFDARGNVAPTQTMVWALTVGSAVVATLMIAGACYYQHHRKPKKKKEEKRGKQPGAVKSPSKSILKKVSSYGPAFLHREASESSVTEASSSYVSGSEATSSHTGGGNDPLNQVFLECKL